MKFGKGPKVSVAVEMEAGKILSSRLSLSDTFNCTGADAALLLWLELYSEGKAVPLQIMNKKPFLARVMKALSTIPFGKTISYKELATLSDAPKSARAVGNACGRNPFPLFVPCHRVIRSNGEIGGFAFDSEIKRRLLEFETCEAGKTCPAGSDKKITELFRLSLQV